MESEGGGGEGGERNLVLMTILININTVKTEH